MKEKELLSAVKNFGEEEGDSVALSVSADIDMDDLKHIVYLLQKMIDAKEEYGTENLHETLKKMAVEKKEFEHGSEDSEEVDPIKAALSLMMSLRYALEVVADNLGCDKEDLYKLLSIPENEVEKELEKIYSRRTIFQA